MKILEKKLSKMWLTAICVTSLLVGTAITSAFVLNTYHVPQTANVNGIGSLVITIDGQSWTNGTAIPWGTVTPGTSPQKAITFTNTGTIPITSFTITSTGLPTGWTETLSSLPETLYPGQLASGGAITLTVPANAISGNYSWDSYIAATQ